MKINIVGDFRACKPDRIAFSTELSIGLAQADFNIVNFEAPVECGVAPKTKSGPSLNQSPVSASLLKNHGFNVFLLGNNHTMDYGEEGCKATLETFSDSVTVGAGEGGGAFSMRIIESDGIKVGLLSLVQHEFGVLESLESNGYGVAWIGSEVVENSIREAHKSVDYLFVFPHAGLESVDAPLPEWRQYYRKFIDWGADGVFGSHPHAPQGWEVYKGNYIYYSLGNFYFDGLNYESPHWCNSIMVSVDIEKRHKGGLLISNKYIVFNSSGNIGFDYSDTTREHVEKINALLFDEVEYDKYIKKICRNAYSDYQYGILRSLRGTSFVVGLKYFVRLAALMILKKTNETYLLNVLQCETHRWVVERALRDKLYLE